MSGLALAIGIGLALGAGHGIAAAEPSAPDSAGSEATSSAGTADSVPSKPKKRIDKSSTGQLKGEPVASGADADPVVHGAKVPGSADAHPPKTNAATVVPPARAPSHPSRADDAVSVEPESAALVRSAGPRLTLFTSAQTALATTVPPQAAAITMTAATSDSVDPQAAPAVVVGVFSTLSSGTVTPGAPAPVDPLSLVAVVASVRRELLDSISTDETSPLATVDTTEVVAAKSSTMSKSAAVTTINVRDYGAVGDGVTDDSAAIKAAVAALTSGERLYVPAGDYRFAEQHPDGDAAIFINGLSNVTVEFEPGARLLMDNLDASGQGTSDGIKVEGAATNVTLLNPTIEWVTKPSARSFGDGISVLGWPSDSPPPAGWTGSSGTVSFVSIVNATVVNAPQTGAVIMGASDVTVTNFTAIGTMADGLHFNANRRVTLDGLVAQDTGDDGLAFVTYYDASQPWTYGPDGGPFNQAGLGEWNNGGSVASHITVSGGRASGVRVQGGYDITISDVTVTDKDFGLQVNSAIATGPGDWTSIASRDVHISDVTIDGAQTGIVLATNNIDGTEDPMWWDFSGVSISDVTIRDSENWSVAVETPAVATSKLAGVTLQNIYAEANGAALGGGNGGMLLASLHESVIDNVHLVSDHISDINVLGAAQIRSQLGVADLPSSNLTVNDLVLDGPGQILIQDIAGITVGNVASSGADGSAVVLYRVGDATFDNITAYLPGRGNGAGRGVQLLQVQNVDIADIFVTTDNHIGSSWAAIELGGGGAQSIAGDGVHVENVTYVSGRDDTDSDIVVQGGPYGPVDWYINANWRHEGAAQPVWQSAHYGDVSPL